MLKLLADWWEMFSWQGKRRARLSHRLRTGAFRKGIVWQLLQLMGKFKSVYGLPEQFFQALTEELCQHATEYRYAASSSQRLGELWHNLQFAQKFCYRLYRIFKQAYKESPDLDPIRLVDFALNLVQLATTEGIREHFR